MTLEQAKQAIQFEREQMDKYRTAYQNELKRNRELTEKVTELQAYKDKIEESLRIFYTGK